MSEKTWNNSSIEDASFVSCSDGFNRSERGVTWMLNRFPIMFRSLKYTPEMIHENVNIDGFKHKKILVVGGGPTTDEREWHHEEYDCVFSCNHFFLHPRFTTIQCGLVTLGDEVDLGCKELTDYLDNSPNTMICFENCLRPIQSLKPFYDKYYERCFIASLRYLSKIGATPRLMVLATLCGASEIHVVGMDGYPRGTSHRGNTYHSFQPGKRMQGTYNWQIFHNQFKDLWSYLHKIGPDVKFKNLGEGHPFNMSTGMV